MAKLFANKFDLTRLAKPQKPSENINQGQAALRPKTIIEQEKQAIEKKSLISIPNNQISLDRNKVDLFGKSISLEDRTKQFTAIGSTSHLAEYNLSTYNTRNYRDPFGKSIRLTNRFKQYEEITSTSHLPEYVLSDYNVGYLDKLLGGKRTGGAFVDQTVALRALENAGLFKSINKNYAAVNIERGSVVVSRFPFIPRLERIATTIKLNNLVEFQRSKLTIPNIQISKVKSGDRIIDPMINIIEIEYNNVSILNNNLILGVTTIPTLFLEAFTTITMVDRLRSNPKEILIVPNTRSNPLFSIPLQESKAYGLDWDEFFLSLTERGERLKGVDKTFIIRDQFIIESLIYGRSIDVEDTVRPINFNIQADAIKIAKVKEIENPEERHGTITIGKLEIIPNEFLEIPERKIVFVDNNTEIIRRQNITPNRLTVITSPEARHGTIRLNPIGFRPNEYLGGSFDVARFSYYYSIPNNELLRNPRIGTLFISEYNPNTSIGTSMGKQDFRIYGSDRIFPIQSVDGGEVDTRLVRPLFVSARGLTYSSLYDYGATYEGTDPQNSGPLRGAAFNSTNGKLVYIPQDRAQLNTYNTAKPVLYKDPTDEWQASHGTGLPNIPGDYKTLTYAEIAAKRSSSDRARKDFTVYTSDDSLEVWRVRLGMPDDGLGDTMYRSDKATANDFVKVKIGSLQFRAYITSFSDNYTPSYTDVNYIGRPDTLKVYKNSTRNISLGFKVAAFSDKDMKGMYQKMEALVKTGTMATLTGEYAQGPMTTLTVGGWVQNAPIVLSSLKFDTNPSEYTWDIINEVPHIVDVSLDCVVLASNGGGSPFGVDGTYISYGA